MYNEGKEAFNNLLVVGECPYNVYSDEYEDWVSGWFDARDECSNFFYGD
jgi:hypothetical protein